MSYYRDPEPDRQAFMAIMFLLGLLLLALGRPARADLVTEFGMGVKIEGTTSVIMLPACHLTTIIETRPNTPSLNYRDASCGGDNPAFIGWPIAYEHEFAGPWRVRCGWFHYSNWFDGKRDRETHMDVAACAATFNWSRRK